MRRAALVLSSILVGLAAGAALALAVLAVREGDTGRPRPGPPTTWERCELLSTECPPASSMPISTLDDRQHDP